MSEQTFKVGDKVEWTSQAAGTTKTKRGEIIAVVPEGEEPSLMSRLGEDYATRYKSKVDVPLYGRRHESYLVSVPAKRSDGRPRLYWPRVSQLKKVEDES